MFSKKIIGAGSFLKMPPTSRLLYYDLGMYADDDGVVEAFTVMRQSGATEDDLRVLVTKGYVKILNSDLVTYICDWKVNNLIQSDRYHPSVYKELLIQVGTKLETSWKQVGNNLEPEVKISKVKISKDKISDITTCSEPKDVSELDEAVYSFPLNDKTLHIITKSDFDEYQALYPAVDIMQQFRSMTGWFKGNPKKLKTARGIKRFISSWLSKEQDKGGATSGGPRAQASYGHTAGCPQPVGTGETVI